MFFYGKHLSAEKIVKHAKIYAHSQRIIRNCDINDYLAQECFAQSRRVRCLHRPLQIENCHFIDSQKVSSSLNAYRLQLHPQAPLCKGGCHANSVTGGLCSENFQIA